MSRRKKIERFQELARFPQVLQKPAGMAGQWQAHFPQPQPLVVELGCGYGEYTIGLAQRYADRNYIGLDVQGERLWRGAQDGQTLRLTNVLWLRGQVDHLLEYFAPGEITELWLTFPDPFPKDRHAKRRLTALRFLELYRTVLVPGGRVHLKTDARALFLYTQENLEDTGAQIDRCIENVLSGETTDDLDIITRFERKHRSRQEPIYYLVWHWLD